MQGKQSLIWIDLVLSSACCLTLNSLSTRLPAVPKRSMSTPFKKHRTSDEFKQKCKWSLKLPSRAFMKFSPNSSCVSIPGHTPAGAHEIIPSARPGLRFLLQAGLQPAQQMIRAVGTRGMWKIHASQRWSPDGRWHLQPPGEGAFDASQAQG